MAELKALLDLKEADGTRTLYGMCDERTLVQDAKAQDYFGAKELFSGYCAALPNGPDMSPYVEYTMITLQKENEGFTGAHWDASVKCLNVMMPRGTPPMGVSGSYDTVEEMLEKLVESSSRICPQPKLAPMTVASRD